MREAIQPTLFPAPPKFRAAWLPPEKRAKKRRARKKRRAWANQPFAAANRSPVVDGKAREGGVDR